jgi:hypothetical protein
VSCLNRPFRIDSTPSGRLDQSVPVEPSYLTRPNLPVPVAASQSSRCRFSLACRAIQRPCPPSRIPSSPPVRVPGRAFQRSDFPRPRHWGTGQTPTTQCVQPVHLDRDGHTCGHTAGECGPPTGALGKRHWSCNDGHSRMMEPVAEAQNLSRSSGKV